jgi:hypothetical protein
MICLRCGHCCKHYMVAIVADPDKGISEDNLEVNKGDGTPCRHLKGDKPGEYSCAIHDKSWYCETPCFAHGQIEQGNTNCRLGEHILKQREKYSNEAETNSR